MKGELEGEPVVAPTPLELRQLQRKLDVRTVMESPAGRRLLWAWLHEWGLFDGSFTGEALSSAHAEGRRAIAVTVLQELQQHARASYLDMVSEALEALPDSDE